MTTRIAINGFGRIGRNVMRAWFESDKKNQIDLVAINDLGDVHTNVHLLKYDSVHGRFPGEIHVDGNDMVVDNHKIRVLAERNPEKLPWKDLNIDIVLECTGLFTSRDKSSMHLTAGAKKVLISAPAGEEVDATIVYGVNHQVLKPTDKIVSNASCTTNCLAPLAKVLHSAFGVKQGLMTTVHSFTNDQHLVDTYHKDLRRARAATLSMIPTKTGAAAAVGLVIPELDGKLDGYAIRIPTANVSIVDFTFVAEKKANVDEVNRAMRKAAESSHKGIISYNDEQLVSVDYNHNPYSCNFDATLTRQIDHLIKVSAWYDNEWGFSNRMLDTMMAMGK